MLIPNLRYVSASGLPKRRTRLMHGTRSCLKLDLMVWGSLFGISRVLTMLPRVDVGSWLFVLILRRICRARDFYPDILERSVAE